MTETSRKPAARIRAKRTPKWWIKRLIRLLVIAYVVVGLLLWVGQRWLVFPGTVMQGSARTRFGPAIDSEQLTLHTADGTEIAAVFYPAIIPRRNAVTTPARRPTVISFYGNAQCVAWCQYEVDIMRRCGANVLVADYPGFGQSKGTASELGMYATADALWNHAMGRPDVDPSRIIASGWSLGGAAAIDLASRKPVAGLIAASSFTSLPDMGHKQFPIYPTSWLLRYKMDNLQKIGSIQCPTLFIHGLADPLVPAEMSRRLYAASGASTRTLLEIPDAQHNDLFATGYFPISEAIAEFLTQTAH